MIYSLFNINKLICRSKRDCGRKVRVTTGKQFTFSWFIMSVRLEGSGTRFSLHKLILTLGRCQRALDSEHICWGCWLVMFSAAGDVSDVFSWPLRASICLHYSKPESNKSQKVWVFPFPQLPQEMASGPSAEGLEEDWQHTLVAALQGSVFLKETQSPLSQGVPSLRTGSEVANSTTVTQLHCCYLKPDFFLIM